MTADNYYKLDNPAWYSLTETHKHFAVGNEVIKRYSDTVAPFAAFLTNKKYILSQLDKWVNPNDSFFIIGDPPDLPFNYTIETKLLCVQMICTSVKEIIATVPIQKLGEADDEQMVSLISQVQPGYYKPGTRLMGDYFGIHNNGQLVSMAGERMCMDGLNEISAVVTHPAFTGRKYAQQLVACVTGKIVAAGNIPFLHVAATNERAIKLYEHLGFVQRRTITFWKIKREG